MVCHSNGTSRCFFVCVYLIPQQEKNEPSSCFLCLFFFSVFVRYGEQLKDAIPKASKRTSGSGPGTTLAACLAKSMEREVLSEMVPWSTKRA